MFGRGSPMSGPIQGPLVRDCCFRTKSYKPAGVQISGFAGVALQAADARGWTPVLHAAFAGKVQSLRIRAAIAVAVQHICSKSNNGTAIKSIL